MNNKEEKVRLILARKISMRGEESPSQLISLFPCPGRRRYDDVVKKEELSEE